MLHTIRLQKEHWAIKAVAVCVCVHSSFSIPLIDYLVSWQNYFPFVAMASRKSISLMFWTYCTITALKMFLLTDFDLGCFSVSTLELVSVVLCFFHPEKSWNSVVRTLRVWWSRGITWRKRSSNRKRQTTGEWLVCILCSYIGCFCFLQPPCIPLCLFLPCSVAVFRLRAQHKNLCQKLQSEEELEGHINTELKQQEWVSEEKGLAVRSCSDSY